MLDSRSCCSPPAQQLRTLSRLTLARKTGIVPAMPVAVTDQKRRAWSDAELEALPKEGHKYELLDGLLIMSPVHLNHSLICMRLGRRLGNFVEKHNAGETFDSSVGCRLAPDLLLSPDVSFVSRASLAKLNIGPDKFLSGAPDLVVEVLSAGDRMTKINRKVEHYFEHGTRLAWLVNWRKEQIIIYTPDSVESLTRPSDVLTGGEVLPGFKCKLAEIFRAI
jgi:Uma2 family endonuclease